VCRCRLRSAFNVMNFNPSNHKKKNILLRINGVRRYFRITCMLLLLLAGLTCAGYAQIIETADSEGPFPGFLKIEVVEVDSFYVVVNNDFSNVYHFASGDSIALEQGIFRITLAKAYFRDVSFRATIREEETRSIRAHMYALTNLPATKKQSSFPRIHWGAGTVVVSDHDSDIYVDGEYSGTGFAVVNHSERFTVESRNPAGDVRSRTFRPAQALLKFLNCSTVPTETGPCNGRLFPGLLSFTKTST